MLLTFIPKSANAYSFDNLYAQIKTLQKQVDALKSQLAGFALRSVSSEVIAPVTKDVAPVSTVSPSVTKDVAPVVPPTANIVTPPVTTKDVTQQEVYKYVPPTTKSDIPVTPADEITLKQIETSLTKNATDLKVLSEKISTISANTVTNITPIKTTTKMIVGTVSSDVVSLQKILIKKGYLTGVADGKYGKGTAAAIMKFQKDNGSKMDGIAGKGTIKLLNSLISTYIPCAVTELADINGNTTTVVTPSITVLSPNGGEIFSGINSTTVKWSSCGISSTANVKITLQDLSNSLSGFPVILSASTTNDGQETVTFPAGYGSSFKIKVELVTTGTNSVSDVSDNKFSIVPAQTACAGLTVTKDSNYTNQTTTPNSSYYKIGSYLLKNNCNEDIKISKISVAFAGPSGAVPLSDITNLKLRDSYNFPISSAVISSVVSAPNDFSFQNNIITVPSNTVQGVDLYADIGATSSVPPYAYGLIETNLTYDALGSTTNTQYPTGPTILWAGGQTITINSSSAQPSITITSPNGGESYTPGQQITVTWTSQGIPASTPVVIYLDNFTYTPATTGGTFGLTGSTPNDGSETVVLPTTISFPTVEFGNKFKVRINVNNSNPVDSSDNLFTINTIAPVSYVYVADSYNNRVQKFDLAGNYIAQWGTAGIGNGQFGYVGDVAVAPNGNVYVTDNNQNPQNNRVQKFDSAGNYISQLVTPDNSVMYPANIALDSSGNVYIADMFNNRILKFNSSGTFVAQWGTPGSGNGQFNIVSGIAVAPNGNVYVSDEQNNRVQEFTASGVYVTQWGTYGIGNGQFNFLLGLDVASNGNVYVVDGNNRRVQEFDSAGNYITEWGSQNSLPGDVAVASNGNVYVTDHAAYSIKKFSSSLVLNTQWGSTGTGNGQFNSPYGIAISN